MVSGLNQYAILTADARESDRLQRELFIPSNHLHPVSILNRSSAFTRAADAGMALYYTDDAVDALTRSAGEQTGYNWVAEEDATVTPWRAYRSNRTRFSSVRPLEAWLHLYETCQEELQERYRHRNIAAGAYSVIESFQRIKVARASLSYLDLVNLERRRVASMVRAHAADRLIRIAPARIVLTETPNDTDTMLTIRARWEALPAAERKVPEWLVNGMETPRLQVL